MKRVGKSQTKFTAKEATLLAGEGDRCEQMVLNFQIGGELQADKHFSG